MATDSGGSSRTNGNGDPAPYGLELRSEVMRSIAVLDERRRGHTDTLIVGCSESSDVVSGHESVEVRGAMTELVKQNRANVAGEFRLHVHGKLSLHDKGDTALVGGSVTESHLGATLLMAGMSDDMIIGGGARATAPVDVMLAGLIGMEQKIGTATADGVLTEMYVVGMEREYGPGVHACTTAVFSGAVYCTQATGFMPMMRTWVGIRNLTPGAGAGGGGGGGGSAPSGPAGPAGAPPVEGAMVTARVAGGISGPMQLEALIQTAENAGDLARLSEDAGQSGEDASGARRADLLAEVQTLAADGEDAGTSTARVTLTGEDGRAVEVTAEMELVQDANGLRVQVLEDMDDPDWMHTLGYEFDPPGPEQGPVDTRQPIPPQDPELPPTTPEGELVLVVPRPDLVDVPQGALDMPPPAPPPPKLPSRSTPSAGGELVLVVPRPDLVDTGADTARYDLAAGGPDAAVDLSRLEPDPPPPAALEEVTPQMVPVEAPPGYSPGTFNIDLDAPTDELPPSYTPGSYWDDATLKHGMAGNMPRDLPDEWRSQLNPNEILLARLPDGADVSAAKETVDNRIMTHSGSLVRSDNARDVVVDDVDETIRQKLLEIAMLDGLGKVTSEDGVEVITGYERRNAVARLLTEKNKYASLLEAEQSKPPGVRDAARIEELEARADFFNDAHKFVSDEFAKGNDPRVAFRSQLEEAEAGSDAYRRAEDMLAWLDENVVWADETAAIDGHLPPKVPVGDDAGESVADMVSQLGWIRTEQTTQETTQGGKGDTFKPLVAWPGPEVKSREEFLAMMGEGGQLSPELAGAISAERERLMMELDALMGVRSGLNDNANLLARNEAEAAMRRLEGLPSVTPPNENLPGAADPRHADHHLWKAENDALQHYRMETVLMDKEHPPVDDVLDHLRGLEDAGASDPMHPDHAQWQAYKNTESYYRKLTDEALLDEKAAILDLYLLARSELDAGRDPRVVVLSKLNDAEPGSPTRIAAEYVLKTLENPSNKLSVPEGAPEGMDTSDLRREWGERSESLRAKADELRQSTDALVPDETLSWADRRRDLRRRKRVIVERAQALEDAARALSKGATQMENGKDPRAELMKAMSVLSVRKFADGEDGAGEASVIRTAAIEYALLLDEHLSGLEDVGTLPKIDVPVEPPPPSYESHNFDLPPGQTLEEPDGPGSWGIVADESGVGWRADPDDPPRYEDVPQTPPDSDLPRYDLSVDEPPPYEGPDNLPTDGAETPDFDDTWSLLHTRRQQSGPEGSSTGLHKSAEMHLDDVEMQTHDLMMELLAPHALELGLTPEDLAGFDSARYASDGGVDPTTRLRNWYRHFIAEAEAGGEVEKAAQMRATLASFDMLANQQIKRAIEHADWMSGMSGIPLPPGMDQDVFALALRRRLEAAQSDADNFGDSGLVGARADAHRLACKKAEEGQNPLPYLLEMRDAAKLEGQSDEADGINAAISDVRMVIARHDPNFGKPPGADAGSRALLEWRRNEAIYNRDLVGALDLQRQIDVIGLDPALSDNANLTRFDLETLMVSDTQSADALEIASRKDLSRLIEQRIKELSGTTADGDNLEGLPVLPPGKYPDFEPTFEDRLASLTNDMEQMLREFEWPAKAELDPDARRAQLEAELDALMAIRFAQDSGESPVDVLAKMRDEAIALHGPDDPRTRALDAVYKYQSSMSALQGIAGPPSAPLELAKTELLHGRDPRPALRALLAGTDPSSDTHRQILRVLEYLETHDGALETLAPPKPARTPRQVDAPPPKPPRGNREPPVVPDDELQNIMNAVPQPQSRSGDPPPKPRRTKTIPAPLPPDTDPNPIPENIRNLFGSTADGQSPNVRTDDAAVANGTIQPLNDAGDSLFLDPDDPPSDVLYRAANGAAAGGDGIDHRHVETAFGQFTDATDNAVGPRGETAGKGQEG